MAKVMLSTVDNPYSPFDEYDAWFTWDIEAGYHTSEFLGRIMNASHEMSDADYDLMIEHAVDECVEENVFGVFIKIVKK